METYIEIRFGDVVVQILYANLGERAICSISLVFGKQPKLKSTGIIRTVQSQVRRGRLCGLRGMGGLSIELDRVRSSFSTCTYNDHLQTYREPSRWSQMSVSIVQIQFTKQV